MSEADMQMATAEEGEGETRKDAGDVKGRGKEDVKGRGNEDVKGRHNEDDSDTASTSGRQKKEYKIEELRRLQESLKKERSNIKRPAIRPHFPNTYTSLEPYMNTHVAAFLLEVPSDDENSETPEPKKSPDTPRKKRNRNNGEIERPETVSRSRTATTPEEFRHSYISRNTAQGLCDPWVDLRMDHEFLPRLDNQRTSTRGSYSLGRSKERKRQDEKKEKKQFEGSTRLPKFPVVPFHAGKENATQRFPYQDIPKFRREMDQRFSLNAPKKIDSDYRRTKDDFYRMELDRLEDVHPLNRPHMRKAYFAYLQNTPGSKKAITECVRSLEGPAQQHHHQSNASLQEAN